MPVNPTLKAKAIRLRTEERLSYREIGNVLGVPKGTLSGWLRHLPLSAEEKKQKMGVRGYRAPKKDRGIESSLHQRVPASSLSPHQKAKVAEAAALLRLVVHGLIPYGSLFDGDKADWLAENPTTGVIHKIQVKWATTHSKYGLPVVSLRCTEGHNTPRRYQQGEFDFLIGYDYFTDTCYVWSWDEVAHLKVGVTICPEAAERWNKITGT